MFHRTTADWCAAGEVARDGSGLGSRRGAAQRKNTKNARTIDAKVGQRERGCYEDYEEREKSGRGLE